MKKELTSIFDLEKAPRVLIEASAGTGKTYTIVGIYVRLLIEEQLSVDQILAVTFTKKATAELRERLLLRLRECLEAVEEEEHSDTQDEFLMEFAARYGGSKEVASTLQNAIRNFDDSQVFTIHGFCQKILQEEALSAGTPFEMTVNPSGNLYETAAEDFWRSFMVDHDDSSGGRYLITKLLGLFSSPADLVGKNGISPLLSKQYANAEGETIDRPKVYLSNVLTIKAALADLFKTESETIYKILNTCDISHYSRGFETRWKSMTRYLEDESFTIDRPEKLDRFTSEYLYDDNRLKKGGSPVERHRFFELCSELRTATEDIEKVETTIIKRAYEDIIKRRDKLSTSSDAYNYDDLLTEVRDALIKPGDGERLAGRLNHRFPVALVDEFQDTDPIQYDIFKTIYPADGKEGSLMMIGDPKQAIYAFRGADLHTYFKARRDGISHEYTLRKNYRSTVEYINAINHLFAGDHQPFVEDDITFEPSLAGRSDHTDALSHHEKMQPPLEILTRRGVSSNKDQSCQFAFDQTVERIAAILSDEHATIGSRRVAAGDIAVLISRNKDAYSLQQRLKAAGIDSVTKTDQNIFETLEARKTDMLMNAVLNPTDQRVVNAGLLTGMFGFDLNSLRQLASDEDARQLLVEELSNLSDFWRREGFYSMFYRLMYTNSRLLNFTKIHRSERVITNFFHLADLCAVAEKDQKLSPEKLHTWLKRQMEQTDLEEKELQLESDRNLVKIMTIHASKGLQFPIVFCPTLWMGYKPEGFTSSAKRIVEYHSDETESLIINFDRQMNEKRRLAEYLSDMESIAEDVRKTYVALTRTMYHTIVIWDHYAHSNVSGLGASLIGREGVIKSLQNNLKVKEDTELTDSTFLSRFRSAEKASNGSVSVNVIDDGSKPSFNATVQLTNQSDIDFRAYAGRQELKVQKSVDSFTSLASHGTEPGQHDYDQLLDNFSAPFDAEQSSGVDRDDQWSIFDFPKGSTAGTAIHKLFEHEDFKFITANDDDHTALIHDILDEYRFDRKWTPAVQQMIRNVTGCVIPGIILSELSVSDERREMEFHFPSGNTDGKSLLSVIRDRKQTSLTDAGGQRFMTGFIDLIARQNGKYMIIDYKSNFLGDSPEDYTRDRLKEEIMTASYDLQYHLYTLALVKYLRAKLPGFDYDQHIAGAAYLFVRGIKKGSDSGVWFHKPDKDVIIELERMISR